MRCVVHSQIAVHNGSLHELSTLSGINILKQHIELRVLVVLDVYLLLNEWQL